MPLALAPIAGVEKLITRHKHLKGLNHKHICVTSLPQWLLHQKNASENAQLMKNSSSVQVPEQTQCEATNDSVEAEERVNSNFGSILGDIFYQYMVFWKYFWK